MALSHKKIPFACFSSSWNTTRAWRRYENRLREELFTHFSTFKDWLNACDLLFISVLQYSSVWNQVTKKPVCFNMLFHWVWFIEAKNNSLVFYKYLSGYISSRAKSTMHSVFAEQLPVLSERIIILWSAAHVSSNTLSLKHFRHPPDLKGEAGCNFSNRFLVCWRCRSMSGGIMYAPAVKKKEKRTGSWFYLN